VPISGGRCRRRLQLALEVVDHAGRRRHRHVEGGALVENSASMVTGPVSRLARSFSGPDMVSVVMIWAA
jgi:hypothetical protein